MNKEPRLDPRTALYVVVLLSTAAFFMNKEYTAHMILAVAALYLIGIKAYKPFFCYTITYGILAFLTSYASCLNNQTVMLAMITISYLIQKLIVLIIMGTFLMRSISVSYALSAMQTMKVPDAILIPFTVAMRFFPTIMQEQRSLKESLKIRKISVSPLQFLIHPVRTSEYMIVPILIRSLKTADELAASALVRGIESDCKKTILYPLKFKSVDYITALFTTLVAAILFYLQFK